MYTETHIKIESKVYRQTNRKSLQKSLSYIEQKLFLFDSLLLGGTAVLTGLVQGKLYRRFEYRKIKINLECLQEYIY